MDFDLIWDVVKITGVSAAVSAMLNYLFPSKSSATTTSARWIDFFSGLLQFAVYLTLAYNTVEYIDPGPITPIASVSFLWGIWFMPQMTAKIVDWFQSLQLPNMHSASASSCSSCPSQSADATGTNQ